MKRLLMLWTGILLFSACQKQIPNEEISETLGIDATKTANKIVEINMLPVTICNQTWMRKNLDVTTYRNGNPIPQVTDPTQWANLKTGAWCYYNNEPANGAVYGKLYNWYAVNDPRGLAPLGWHVPSDAEWKTLSTCLGGVSVAGGKMKEKRSERRWYEPNTGATNSSGFTGLPGGVRGGGTIGEFGSIGYLGAWWSSTEEIGSYASALVLGYQRADAARGVGGKPDGFSVRCVRD